MRVQNEHSEKGSVSGGGGLKVQRLLLRKRTKGRRRADGSVSVTFARMSSSLVWLKLQVFRGVGAKK